MWPRQSRCQGQAKATPTVRTRMQIFSTARQLQMWKQKPQAKATGNRRKKDIGHRIKHGSGRGQCKLERQTNAAANLLSIVLSLQHLDCETSSKIYSCLALKWPEQMSLGLRSLHKHPSMRVCLKITRECELLVDDLWHFYSSQCPYNREISLSQFPRNPQAKGFTQRHVELFKFKESTGEQCASYADAKRDNIASHNLPI